VPEIAFTPTGARRTRPCVEMEGAGEVTKERRRPGVQLGDDRTQLDISLGKHQQVATQGRIGFGLSHLMEPSCALTIHKLGDNRLDGDNETEPLGKIISLRLHWLPFGVNGRLWQDISSKRWPGGCARTRPVWLVCSSWGMNSTRYHHRHAARYGGAGSGLNGFWLVPP
jgi:hypothetical protein